MRKYGFTLAEVLITLGIIGVVAALTTPSLIQNVANAKIPPALQKAKATFETAAEMMLVEESVNSILAVTNSSEDLGKELSKYMKISREDCYQVSRYNDKQTSAYSNNPAIDFNNFVCFSSDDGMSYRIYNTGTWWNHNGTGEIPDKRYQTIGFLWVDINGKSAPNKLAKDLFYFYIQNDGSLIPCCGSRTDNSLHWKEHKGCDKDGVTVDYSCAASIFDNGMKIIYQ